MDSGWTLQWRDGIAGLALDAGDAEFLRSLGGPTAIRIPGRDRTRCRAVVTLLHGNEPSGMRALRAWFRSEFSPVTDLLVVFGNVQAGLVGQRLLDDGRDLNRCFLPPFDGPEGSIASQILEAIHARPMEALIDLHNNTGRNPAYGVATDAKPERIGLVAPFGHRCVVSDIPLGSLMEALDPSLPSLTVECGRAGDRVADETALRGLRAFVGTDDIVASARASADGIGVLENPRRVCLRQEIGIDFAERRRPGAGLTLTLDIDRHNFERMPAGELVGWIDPGTPWPIYCVDAAGRDASRQLFASVGDELRTRVAMTPIMMTTEPRIAREDCLFYVVDPRS